MPVNPEQIGENVIGEIKNLTSGDIEIAGKKIPKIALIGLGIGGVFVLFLLSKKGVGGSTSIPFQSATVPGTEGGTGFGNSVTSDTPVGENALNEDFQQQITDLTDLISNNAADNANLFNDQISALQGQIDNLNYSYPVSPLPVDTYSEGYDPFSYGGYDAGFSNFSPVNIPSVTPSKKESSLNFIDQPLLKPSKVKDQGGKPKKPATLGSALSRPSGLISKLTGNAPKLSSLGSFKPSAVTSFGKKEIVKPKQPVTISLNKQGKQSVFTAKPGAVKPTGIYTPQASPKKKSGFTIVQKQPKQPVKTAQKTTYSPVSKPRIQPVTLPGNFAPRTYNNFFSGFSGFRGVNVPNKPKISTRSKKGR